MKTQFFSLCLLFVLAAWQGGRGESWPASPEEIQTLIAQLGSPKFAERGAAFKTLDSIGDPALSALRKAESTNQDPEIRRRAKQLIDGIENRLDHLLAVYREYGLPFPPQKSNLVRFGSFDGGLVNGKLQPVLGDAVT